MVPTGECRGLHGHLRQQRPPRRNRQGARSHAPWQATATSESTRRVPATPRQNPAGAMAHAAQRNQSAGHGQAGRDSGLRPPRARPAGRWTARCRSSQAALAKAAQHAMGTEAEQHQGPRTTRANPQPPPAAPQGKSPNASRGGTEDAQARPPAPSRESRQTSHPTQPRTGTQQANTANQPTAKPNQRTSVDSPPTTHKNQQRHRNPTE